MNDYFQVLFNLKMILYVTKKTQKVMTELKSLNPSLPIQFLCGIFLFFSWQALQLLLSTVADENMGELEVFTLSNKRLTSISFDKSS